MEIETFSLSGREPIIIKFNSDEYGTFGVNFEINDYLATKSGIVLKNIGPAKFKSLKNEFEFWYSFKAQSLGSVCDTAKADEKTIMQWAIKNPDMVLHSWADVEAEYSHWHDFKRSKRPFISFNAHGGDEIGVLWEFYQSERRIGVYTGQDKNGLGGYVNFFDQSEIKIL